MRALFHPSLDDITVEGVLHALSDPIRAQIYMQLARSEDGKICSAFLKIKKVSLPKSTLSQHFKVLREAGLVRSEKCGVALINSTRCEELKSKFGLLVPSILEAYQKPISKKKN